jgi:hypothetical protein
MVPTRWKGRPAHSPLQPGAPLRQATRARWPTMLAAGLPSKQVPSLLAFLADACPRRWRLLQTCCHRPLLRRTPLETGAPDAGLTSRRAPRHQILLNARKPARFSVSHHTPTAVLLPPGRQFLQTTACRGTRSSTWPRSDPTSPVAHRSLGLELRIEPMAWGLVGKRWLDAYARKKIKEKRGAGVEWWVSRGREACTCPIMLYVA